MNEKVLRIAQLVLEINDKTNYAACFEIAGFIKGIIVSVRESTKNYNDYLLQYDLPVYLDIEGAESKLNGIIADLEGFLNEEVKEAI